MASYVENEVLRYAIDNGIIDLSSVQEEMEKQKNEYYLSLHPFKIWEGSNGKWYTYIPKKEGRVLRKRNTEKDIKAVVIKYYKSQEENPTIKSVFTEWIKRKLRLNEISKGTYDRYYNDYKRFFKGTDFEQRKLANLIEEELEDFIRETIAKHKLTQKAFSNFRTLIYGIFKYAKKKKYTTISITEFMGDLEISRHAFKRVKKKKEDQIYLEDEIPLMTEYLKSNPTILNLGILLAFQTGLRVGELSTLKFSDVVGRTIHIQRQEIRYRHPDTNKLVCEVVDHAKTDEGDRYVIVTDSAMETIDALRKINPNGEFLFEEDGKWLFAGNGRYDKGLRKACNHLKIKSKSMHKIRRTYGTTLIDANVDDSIVMEQMGHGDIETTRKYYYYSNKNQKSREAQIKNAINI